MGSATYGGEAGTPRLTLHWGPDRAARVTWGEDDGRPVPSQPMVEILAAGQGRDWAGTRTVGTSIGGRLRYLGHGYTVDRGWCHVWLTQVDRASGVECTVEFSFREGLRGLRAVTRVRNVGQEPVTLHAVSSLVFADFADFDGDADAVGDLELLRGRNDWLAEGRWRWQRLREHGLPDLREPGKPFRSRGAVTVASDSTWSTLQELPCAVLRDGRSGRTWSFQVEHNGPWTWQVGEVEDGCYLALGGPTDEQHQWQLELAPGEDFESVPASVVLEDPCEGSAPFSLTGMTRFRRASSPAGAGSAPVVFNDYMNTVNGDPTADRLAGLIDAAAAAGAEYFVIDAGWYADDGDWWDSVGAWRWSARRFPQGLDHVLHRVRSHGMVPGLWLEPEVIGVTSPLADQLPKDAFIQRDGVRFVEHGRYHLDFTSPAATTHVTQVLDRLIAEHRVGYFKLDYNIRAGVGSDTAQGSPGNALLQHNRAYLAWIDQARRRHPDVVFENCASGGMRQDFATTSRFHLQSTSDQEDLHSYAPIAAASTMLVTPEKAANWAYPQPEMGPDDIVFTLCTGLLGRLYLSGWLDRMSADQQELVAAAVRAHRQIAPDLDRMTPFWPLGLPGWDDDWVAVGLRVDDHDAGPRPALPPGSLLLTVWRRGSAPGSATLALPVPPPGQQWSRLHPVFPAFSPLTVQSSSVGEPWRVTDELGVTAARTVMLTAAPIT